MRRVSTETLSQLKAGRARHKNDNRTINKLQRTAGNHAVSSLLEPHLQREAVSAPQNEKTSSEANPALVAMYESSVVEPLRTALGFLRSSQRSKGREEIARSAKAMGKLADTYAESDPLLERQLSTRFYEIRGLFYELKPRPVKEIAGNLELAIGNTEELGQSLH